MSEFAFLFNNVINSSVRMWQSHLSIYLIQSIRSPKATNFLGVLPTLVTFQIYTHNAFNKFIDSEANGFKRFSYLSEGNGKDGFYSRGAFGLFGYFV